MPKYFAKDNINVLYNTAIEAGMEHGNPPHVVEGYMSDMGYELKDTDTGDYII